MPYVKLRHFATSPLRHFALAIILTALGWTTAHAQNEECGTTDIPLSQMAGFLAEIDTTATGVVASNSLAASSPWKISVWFYHLRYSDGSTTHQNYDPEQLVGALNSHFGGLFEFVICGITNIDDDVYTQLDVGNSSNELSNLWADVDALNEPLSDNCVRVFLAQTTIYTNGAPVGDGLAHDPLQYARPAVFLVNLNSKICAHELGHFFGLPHTFQDFATQYVHDINTPVTINGVSYTCEQTGDGFCDTPADPRWCSIPHCVISSCSPATDPLGVPYDPNPALLMSYYGECRNSFTGDQRQRMRTLYDFHPAYTFLKNPPQECIAPKYGFIEKDCDGYVIFNPYEPLINLPVQVRSEYLPYCDPNDNKTDVSGRYLTQPQCPTSGVRRVILPDRNFGDDPLNGVSTFDMLLINRQILGTQPFVNPFQFIAADANNSGNLTTFDIVELRKLILGIYTQLPIGISWRYVPKLSTESQPFRDAFYANPFGATLQDPFQGFTRSYKSATSGLTVPNTDSWMDFVALVTTSSLSNDASAWSFTGIKIGDVNCNAVPEGSYQSGGEHEFLVDSGSISSIGLGGVKQVRIFASAPKEVVAWQFGMEYSSNLLNLGNITAGTDAAAFSEENFHIAPADSINSSGRFRAIWYAQNDEPIDINNKVLFEFQATGNQAIIDFTEAFRLENDVLPFLFYDEDGELVPNVSLTLQLTDVPQGFQAPVLPGSLDQRSKSFSVKAYPVPFTSEVEFAFDLPQDGKVQLDIFDARGALISSTSRLLFAGLQELHVADLKLHPSGFYWYSIQVGDNVAQGKLSKR